DLRRALPSSPVFPTRRSSDLQRFIFDVSKIKSFVFPVKYWRIVIRIVNRSRRNNLQHGFKIIVILFLNKNDDTAINFFVEVVVLVCPLRIVHEIGNSTFQSVEYAA